MGSKTGGLLTTEIVMVSELLLPYLSFAIKVTRKSPVCFAWGTHVKYPVALLKVAPDGLLTISYVTLSLSGSAAFI